MEKIIEEINQKTPLCGGKEGVHATGASPERL